MKGAIGFAIAGALAVVGALCNWFYVHRQAAGFEKVDFAMISPDAQLNSGDLIKESHLTKVPIPKQYAEQLRQVAYLYSDRITIIGNRATRSYRGGELILFREILTPTSNDTADLIGPDQLTFEVPIDSRTFVSNNYNPGDMVYFFAPQYLVKNPAQNVNPGANLVAGPFRILAMGDRKNSASVDKASRRRATREDVITVGVEYKDGEFGKDAQTLMQLLQATGNKGVQVAKQSSKTKTASPGS